MPHYPGILPGLLTIENSSPIVVEHVMFVAGRGSRGMAKGSVPNILSH